MAKDSIADLWNTRFHRGLTGERLTKEWIFYISRPGLELLRKTDNAGIQAYEQLRFTVQQFLKENDDALTFSGPFTMQTKSPIKNSESKVYSTLMYPFDVQDEVKKKRGVVIHLGEGEAEDTKSTFTYEQHSTPSMFDAEFRSKFDQHCTEQSKQERPLPPGADQADPMWAEFPSSKVLPTDQLLDESGTQGRFRTIISHQFIEIRLISSLGQARKSSREQVDALLRFTSFDSGYTHFAGAPGTGKSTLLHMIVAHQIFNNFRARRKGQKSQQILYYIPSPYLKDEARREIRTILEEVYEPAIRGYVPNWEQMREGFTTDVEFVAQEDLFLTNTPRRKFNITHDSVEALRASLNIKLTDEKTNLRLRETRKGLRRVVFGVFGDHLNFQEWIHGLRGKSIQDGWTKKKISLALPSQRESLMHKINLDTFHPADQAKQLAADVAKLPLYDGKGQDQFWDATALVHQSSKLPNHPAKSVWSKLKGRVDVMVVDEIQDISITEIRVLLDHFSNRKMENDYADFRMVGAGDENQNVKGLVYMPNNSHFRSLFADWAQELRQQGKTRDGMQLSHELRNYQDETLASSYRVFDEMVPYATEILGHLRTLHKTTTAHQRVAPAKMELTQFGRKGMFLTCMTRLNSKEAENIDLWGNSIINYLEKQLMNPENPVIRVAFIYDEVDTIDVVSSSQHPLSERLGRVKHTLGERIRVLMQTFTQSLLDKWRDDPPQSESDEWRRELSLRGVMSVKDIKGLTVPIAVVLPPIRATSKEQGLKSDDALAKFLVQITRAQYCNLLLEETRVLENRKAIDTRLTVNKTTWLNTIIEHSVGFNQTFTNLFEATLRESESGVLWKRLSDRALAIDPSLHNYVAWLREFHSQLSRPKNDLPEGWDKNYVHRPTKSSGEPSIVLDSGDKLSITKIQELEEEFFLGQRLDRQILNSLHLFVLCNSLIRRKASNENTVPTKFLQSGMQAWLDDLNQSEAMDYDTVLARDWFEVVLGGHDRNEESTVKQAIEATFRVEEQWIWPNLSLPRLNMGAWRLNAGPLDLQNEDVEAAWMMENSSFYNMTTQPLVDVAESVHDRNDVKWIRLKLFISMTALDATLFSEAVYETLQLKDKQERTVLLNWFVEVFAREQDRSSFKAAVQQHLEASLTGRIGSGDANRHLGKHLASINSIPALEKLLTAFGFEEWHRCVKLEGLLERTIELTYKLVEPQLTHEMYSKQRQHLNRQWMTNQKKLQNNADALERLHSERQPIRVKLEDRDVFSRIERLDADEFKDEMERLEFGSLRWSAYNNEKRVREHLETEVYLNTRRRQYEKDITRLEMLVNEHTSTHGEYVKLNNPFRLNSPVHRLFKAYFEGLRREENIHHRAWFNLLYGVESLLNGDLSLAQLPELNIHFPSMNTEFLKKLHVCVDVFVDEDLTTQLERWVEQIESYLSPRRKEPEWLAPLLNLLSSIKQSYRKVEEEISKPDSMFKHRHINGSVTTLERRLYQTFIRRCGDLPRLFLGLVFNAESDQTVRLSSQELQHHVNSQKGRLIHSVITAEFEIEPAHIADQWSTIKWEGRDNFVQNFGQKDVDSNIQLLLHEPWTSSATVEPSFPTRFCSGATLRAIAHLCLGSLNEAERCFRDAGLMNHHAALKLHRIMQAGGDRREDLVTAICEIIASEVELFDEAMASADTEANKNKRYIMNFGPSLRRSCLQFESNQDKNHLKIRDVEEATNRWFVQFWRVASLVSHSHQDRNTLNAMLQEVRNPDLFRKHLDGWWAKTAARRTMFVDDRVDERGARLNPTTRFEWKWKENGYEACDPQSEFSRKEVVFEFLSTSMTRNPVPTSSDMALSISKLTNVDGPTLVLLMPDRAHLEMEVLEEETEHERTVRTHLTALEEFLRETKALVEYAKQRGARRAFMSMLNDLNDPKACLEHLAYSVGVRNDHYQHLLESLIQVAVLTKTEVPRDLVVEDLNIPEAMAEQHGLVFEEEK